MFHCHAPECDPFEPENTSLAFCREIAAAFAEDGREVSFVRTLDEIDPVRFEAAITR